MGQGAAAGFDEEAVDVAVIAAGAFDDFVAFRWRRGRGGGRT